MLDYFLNMLYTGGGIAIIIGIAKKFIPKEKIGDAVEVAGNFVSTTGGIKFGKAFWKGCEDFIIEWLNYLFYRLKKGVRSDNPELLKKLEIMEKLRAKVKKENHSNVNKK